MTTEELARIRRILKELAGDYRMPVIYGCLAPSTETTALTRLVRIGLDDWQVPR